MACTVLVTFALWVGVLLVVGNKGKVAVGTFSPVHVLLQRTTTVATLRAHPGELPRAPVLVGSIRRALVATLHPSPPPGPLPGDLLIPLLVGRPGELSWCPVVNMRHVSCAKP